MSLKYRPKSGVYKNYNENNMVDLENILAVSYGWWPYLRKIGNTIIFNGGYYSNPTSKHQSQCRHLLNHHNINIDFYVRSTCHLNNLQGILTDYKLKVKELINLIRKPKTRKSTNIERFKRIKQLANDIRQIRSLIKQERL